MPKEYNLLTRCCPLLCVQRAASNRIFASATGVRTAVLPVHGTSQHSHLPFAVDTCLLARLLDKVLSSTHMCLCLGVFDKVLQQKRRWGSSFGRSTVQLQGACDSNH